MFHFIRHRHHLSLHTAQFRRLVYLSWFYIAFSLLTTLVAVYSNLKAQFGGWKSNLNVWQDFLIGLGTAISPPLILLLIMVVLVDLSFHHNKTARFALGLLVVLSLINSVAALFQPMLSQTNLGFVYTLLHLLMVVQPFILMWLAMDIFLIRINSALKS